MRVVPPCFNRPARDAGSWELRGTHAGTGKPLYRWRRSAFEDRCATHDGRGIGPNGESYPQAHGWDCAGCRWEPPLVRQFREFGERMMSPVLSTTPSPTFAEMVARRVDELSAAAMSAVNFEPGLPPSDPAWA